MTMSEIPKLTLEPNLNEGMPSLTLDPTAPAEPKKEIVPVTIEETKLTPEEQKAVDEFAEKIDIDNTNMVLQYGAAAQKSIADFSGSALEKVRSKDLGEVGDMITELVVELKGFDATEESKGLFGLFKKTRNKVEVLKTRYDKAENSVNRITGMLEEHQVTLMKDIAMLDKMYEMNLQYFKELTMYILAGKKKLEQVQTVDLPALNEKAKASGLPEDAQAANDLANRCNRFEKKLHDLELTRNISVQMAPQIRLIQNNDSLMAEKIQSSIVNTIPLWKSQMVLALGLAHSQQAMQAQRAVTDMTNEMLKKNAEMLKTGSIETAKESERGIVDIETLRQTNQSLISTLDEVLKIQQEGREKRRAAEQELTMIEGELKAKLLELR
ncbi:toxic anion resistance protein [Clostridiales bacterium BX7]|uniref:Toxic anion resistance protein n=2 Tax=Feifania hominis TaxID=2763660 RepID=A0A926DFF2_9FIRM|nr:toxic anion resistance protein [Feifania hominis]